METTRRSQSRPQAIKAPRFEAGGKVTARVAARVTARVVVPFGPDSHGSGGARTRGSGTKAEINPGAVAEIFVGRPSLAGTLPGLDPETRLNPGRASRLWAAGWKASGVMPPRPPQNRPGRILSPCFVVFGNEPSWCVPFAATVGNETDGGLDS